MAPPPACTSMACRLPLAQSPPPINLRPATRSKWRRASLVETSTSQASSRKPPCTAPLSALPRSSATTALQLPAIEPPPAGVGSMSSPLFATRFPRLRSASIVVLLAAGGFGLWMLFLNPLSSSAAPSINNDRDVGAATANLEVLHQRTVAATRAHEDDDQQNTTWGHAVTPEQATAIAQKVARARD